MFKCLYLDICSFKTLPQEHCSLGANMERDMNKKKLLFCSKHCLLRVVRKVEKRQRTAVGNFIESMTEHNSGSLKFLIFDPQSDERDAQDIFVEVTSRLLIVGDIRMMVKTRRQMGHRLLIRHFNALIVRLFLREDFGISPEDVTWVRGGYEEAGRVEKIAVNLPSGVRLENAPDGKTPSNCWLWGAGRRHRTACALLLPTGRVRCGVPLSQSPGGCYGMVQPHTDLSDHAPAGNSPRTGGSPSLVARTR